MDSKFLAFAAIASMLVFGATAVAVSAKAAYASDDKWYVGEGAQKNMYVKYRIQELDVNNDDPFTMTIYFQDQDAKGNWNAPTYVEYQGKVYTGTMKLGDNLASLSGGSDIPDDMRTFIGGYGRSLQWLEAFTSKSLPLSLHAGSWGKIAAIGGQEIKPVRDEKVTVQGGTFDATVLNWHKGVDNNIWVVNDFPYPVKAQTYAEVASGQPPTQFAFELLATGTGKPPVPQQTTEIPKPPLHGTTGRGTYKMDVSWDPASIEPGKETTFAINFYDNSGFPQQRVSYNFQVKDSSGNVLKDLKNQNTESGTAVQKLTFPDGGPKTITITVNSVSGQGTGQFVESADFNVVVVPEFPVSAAIVAAVVIAMVVAVTRFKGTSFGSMFGGKNAV